MKFLGILVLIAAVIAGIYLSGTDIDVAGGKMPNVDVSTSAESGQMPKYKVEKTQEGEMPSVDVDVDAVKGKMPSVSINTPDVDVKTETRTIEVPVGIDVDAARDSVVDEMSKKDALERE